MESGSTSFRSAVPLSVLQIWVSIISTFAKIGHFKGNLPAALWTFLANPQILKAGWNVMQDLKQLKNESQPPNSTPYTGGIELAKLAKEKRCMTGPCTYLCCCFGCKAGQNNPHMGVFQLG
jgi:hypothetical protein